VCTDLADAVAIVLAVRSHGRGCDNGFSISVLRLVGFMSRSFEEVVAFFVPEEVADVSDRLPKLVVHSGCRLSE
jgi:hypothetical protein